VIEIKGGLFKNMKFSFKKIGSVLASGAMLTSTVALAAAANFPSPFVEGGAANVAIVYGSNAASSDLVAVGDVQTHLQQVLATQTARGGTTTSATVTGGNAAELFTGGTKLYLNDSLNTVKTTLTESQLPEVLGDYSFSGNVDATVTHAIEVGFNPSVTFAKQPTSSFDPSFGLSFSSSQANYLYNATATFSKTINLTHADSAGEEIKLFGQTFTVSSSSTGTSLVLLKSAEKLTLSNSDPSVDVEIGGESYTIELISTSSTTATLKITDSSGKTNTKEISENNSKKIGAITIAVTTADATNFDLTATIVAGAEKVTLATGSQVTVGEDDTVVDGSLVTFSGTVPALDKLTISAFAPTSDEDFLRPGESYIDPVFDTIKVDFAGLNIAEDDEVNRETIEVVPSGDDKMTVSLSDYRGEDLNSFMWAINRSSGIALQADEDARNITVVEMGQAYDEEYIVIGNEDDGHLLRVSSITNQTGTSNDKITFIDAFSGDSITTQTSSTEGSATVVVGGKSYSVTFNGASNSAQESRWVRLNYPDSSAAGDMIVYPTIETKKGAKFAFYEPLVITIGSWDGQTSGANNLSMIRFPDGDGYTDVTVTHNFAETWNFTFGSTVGSVNTSVGSGNSSTSGSVGQFTYNISNRGTANTVALYLVSANANVVDPALVIFEEKDDNTNYEALLVTLEPGASSDDGLGVSDLVRTWSGDAVWDAISLHSDSKITKDADLWGTIGTVDTSDSDQNSLSISYPDEQIYAQIYIGEAGATISGGSTSGGTVSALGSVIISDKEVGSVSGKNLIVIGGSCVNSEAANLLKVSSPTCGADFTAATGVGSGMYLIETFSRSGGNVATLVAGYNAADTRNGAKALTTSTEISTGVGSKHTGKTSTDVAMVQTTEVA
jgi:hypothetical protein